MIPYGGWGHVNLHSVFEMENCIIADLEIAIQVEIGSVLYDKMRF